MKTIKFSILLIILSSISSFSQLPPLIDREVFFGDPEISGAQISPNGEYITFIKPFNGVRNIWVKEFDAAFEDARPLTADTTRPITGYFWSVNSEYVLYVQDKGGDENYNIYRVNPKDEGDPVPESANITDYENVRAIIYSVPNKTPNHIIVGINDRNPQLHDVYKLNIADGSKELMWKNDDNVISWSVDLEGKLRLAIKMTPDGGSEILKIEGDSLISIYSVNNEESAAPIRFTEDAKSFYMITNKGDDLDKTQLMLYNLSDDTIEFIEKDPLDEVDFGSAYFSEVTNELVFTAYTADTNRVYFRNDEFEADYNKLKSLLPDGEISLGSSTDDEKVWLVRVSQDTDPGSVYVFDREKGTVEFLYKSRPELPSEHLASMKPIRYTARDGLEIPAYLTLPKGVEAKNLPTVLFVHGGPWARDYYGYDAIAQFLANRGYVVLQPNFRGSTGYGKEFLNAGNKEWGTGAMQHDLTDAVNWLVEQGYSDPNKVAIAGGSYGGYATLAGLAFTPEVYAAGFDIVGPSNIITLLNSIPPYWAPMKKMFAVRVGDMDDPEELKMLQEQSPLNYAENITKPLFVVQGANDPRVKKAEADQIVLALRELNREVEYMLAMDEGHGFSGLENRIAMFFAMEKFFAKHLGGRYQEDLNEDIQERYNELMVDIATVRLPEKKESPQAEKVSTFDGSKVNFGDIKYNITVNARGQEIGMVTIRSVAKSSHDGKEIIVVVDEISGMMAGTDTLIVDAKTLLPIKRIANQGMSKINVTFGSSKIEGSIQAGPQNLPLNLNIDSPVLSDGAGADLAIATLPLAEGYKAQVDKFDLMSAKVVTSIVSVVGSETVDLNGNKIDVYKVEVSPTEEGGVTKLMWFSKDDHRLVKTDQDLPAAMGGGKVTSTIAK